MDLSELELDEALALEPREHLDVAIVGVGSQACGPDLLVYDREILVHAFMKMNDWDREGAIEWIDFNVVQAFVGPGTPIIMEALNGTQEDSG